MDLFEIGQLVRESRKEANMTQAELGQYAGVSRRVISELERGELPDLGFNRMLRILGVLELTVVVTPEAPLRTLDDIARDKEAEANEPLGRRARFSSSRKARP